MTVWPEELIWAIFLCMRVPHSIEKMSKLAHMTEECVSKGGTHLHPGEGWPGRAQHTAYMHTSRASSVGLQLEKV